MFWILIGIMVLSILLFVKGFQIGKENENTKAWGAGGFMIAMFLMIMGWAGGYVDKNHELNRIPEFSKMLEVHYQNRDTIPFWLKSEVYEDLTRYNKNLKEWKIDNQTFMWEMFIPDRVDYTGLLPEHKDMFK